jgi:hypothetical protein
MLYLNYDVFILYIELICLSANSIGLKWRTFKLNELVNLIVNSYEALSDGGNNDASARNLNIKSFIAQSMASEQILSFSMAVNINNMYDILLANVSTQFDSLQQKLDVHYLIFSKTYSFFIRLHIVIERAGVSRRFELISETKNCTTKSIQELFGPAPMYLSAIDNDTLSVRYNLNVKLTSNYQYFKIYLNKVITEKFKYMLEKKILL